MQNSALRFRRSDTCDYQLPYNVWNKNYYKRWVAANPLFGNATAHIFFDANNYLVIVYFQTEREKIQDKGVLIKMQENTDNSTKEYRVNDTVIVVNRLFSDTKTANELILDTISAKNTTKNIFDVL